MHVTTQLGMPGLQTTSSQTINGWWKRMRRSFDKKQKPTFDGLIESASRLLVVLVIMTMQFGRINAFNEMCTGFKVK
jgi:hypothetical protein